MSKQIERAIETSRARKKLAAALPSPDMLRLIRQQSALSQADVAAAIGVSRQAVARYEAGDRTPRADTGERYLELLDRLRGDHNA
jgi:HTH-type transcriptional regulator/antitoxin MqsA